mmetsp:Transcript_36669/g.90921  ORF Transcript_36669/g.90921 Transcript_36669/m.90921 type:complete len:93 (+) Transcript_36669:36-314(+)
MGRLCGSGLWAWLGGVRPAVVARRHLALGNAHSPRRPPVRGGFMLTHSRGGRGSAGSRGTALRAAEWLCASASASAAASPAAETGQARDQAN